MLQVITGDEMRSQLAVLCKEDRGLFFSQNHIEEFELLAVETLQTKYSSDSPEVIITKQVIDKIRDRMDKKWTPETLCKTAEDVAAIHGYADKCPDSVLRAQLMLLFVFALPFRKPIATRPKEYPNGL